ncbi:ECF transporter S component [Alkalicella caledoniensis]|uniref:ECF transporter S component n=1 Tax=Alkalicella caledoniensis TaxID=2731377 RepID=A0A7G9W5B0_ALKCA|nr:ECF transporter S component [Alkalicella caledoniensis]QNO13872.1 ECF transporter S component [Alkalicella caledoniensis]
MKNAVVTSKNSVTQMTYCAIFVGLSYIGALLKIQGSIAFDSMPAYFAAILLGPSLGAVVGVLGHLLTAITSGFPMTLPMHLIIASIMGVTVFLFGWVYKRSNYILASITAIIFNGPVSTLLAAYFSTLLAMQFSGWTLFYAMVIPLTLASAANVILAVILHKAMGKRL